MGTKVFDIRPPSVKGNTVDPQKSESTQQLQNTSANSQLPPGSWIARKVKHTWHLGRGLFETWGKFKVVNEFMTRGKKFDPGNEKREPGEVVVITGGPRGIAYPLVKMLLQLDFTVIMGCRNIESSQAKVDQMRAEGIVNGTVQLLLLNLNSLAATKEFANEVLTKTSRIDYLINNAGVMMTPYECTEDGFEGQFQVNYLGHYLISLLLLPTIKKTSTERETCCRIVNTSSVYHHCGVIDMDELETSLVYSEAKCYYDSKLSQVLFTKELEKRLRQENVNVHTYALHPGAIPTELWATAGTIHKYCAYVLRHFFPTPEDGAYAILNATFSSDLESKGGCYLNRLKVGEPSAQAKDEDLQEQLWSRSDSLVQAFVQ